MDSIFFKENKVKSRLSILLILTCLITMALIPLVSAQGDEYYGEEFKLGPFTYQNGDPIEDGTAILTGDAGAGPYTATLDDLGFATFQTVPQAGVYTLEVSIDGVNYITDEITITSATDFLFASSGSTTPPASTLNPPSGEEEEEEEEEEEGMLGLGKSGGVDNILIIVLLIIIILIVIVGLKIKSAAAKEEAIQEGAAEEVIEFECPQCGATVNESDSACASCGEKFEVEEFECPTCGATVAETSGKCPECGEKFEGQDEPQEGEEEEAGDEEDAAGEDEEASEDEEGEPAETEFQCPECNATIPEDATFCPECEVEFES